MRMATNHLIHDTGSDIFKIKLSGFAGHLCVENDLKQQVAEFVTQRGHVFACDRISHFVGLLHGIRRDRGEVLAHIPGATRVRVAQAFHNFK
jgi:hypothetical protein